MIVGMWNKSVILTYIGMVSAVLGMWLSISGFDLKYAFVCLIIAGVADLFDGTVARMTKRTDDEKLFGIQLDSLVDVLSFISLPISIFASAGMTKPYHALIFVLFSIAGVARLGYFNVVTADSEKAIKYYQGLPVTFCALIFSLIYLITPAVSPDISQIVFSLTFIAVSILELLKINIPKPKGIAYILFGLTAISLLLIYLLVL